MAEFIVEKGKYYNFFISFDPRYGLRLFDLSGKDFSSLEEIADTIENLGIKDERFYVIREARSPNPVTPPDQWPVFYFPSRKLNIGIEVARIKLVD